jgi:peptide-methionine (S)-S-oxide reductase
LFNYFILLLNKNITMKKFISLLSVLVTLSCQSKDKTIIQNTKMELQKNEEVATFAGGCFWCTEAVFLELKGVKSVVSGYIGGTNENPTYEEVSSGYSGHAEAIQIVFDKTQISYGELLEIFFATHDPTTLNRQGADKGTQYRSEVFYHNENQKKLTQDYIALMTAEKTFANPIVTKVSAATKFYNAENYHQNYYNQNKNQSYCTYVITPKIDKLRSKFQSKLKK